MCGTKKVPCKIMDARGQTESSGRTGSGTVSVSILEFKGVATFMKAAVISLNNWR